MAVKFSLRKQNGTDENAFVHVNFLSQAEKISNNIHIPPGDLWYTRYGLGEKGFSIQRFERNINYEG